MERTWSWCGLTGRVNAWDVSCFTSTFSSMKKGSPDTFSNFLSGKSGWRSGMKLLTLFFLKTQEADKTNYIKKRKCRLSVNNSGVPCDRELDEMQQVPGSVTNWAGLVAVAATAQTPEEWERDESNNSTAKWNSLKEEMRSEPSEQRGRELPDEL